RQGFPPEYLSRRLAGFPSPQIRRSNSVAASVCSCAENHPASTAPTSACAGTQPATGSLVPLLSLLQSRRGRRRAKSAPRTVPHFLPAQSRLRHNLSLPVAAAVQPPNLPDKYSARLALR